MKPLSEYIAESAFARENPLAGDVLDLVFNEEVCVSTQVYESSPEHLIFDADPTLMSLLEHCGCAMEESLTPMVPADSASSIPGRHHGALKESPYVTYYVTVEKPGTEIVEVSALGPDHARELAQEQGHRVISVSDTRDLDEAKYQGREVRLGKPMAGDVKKYKVYVRDPRTGNIKKVNFGDKKLSIKRDDPKRRKNFRARHNCAQARDRTSAKYWSCRMWSTKPVSQILKGK
jgi:hypothetical protein